MTDSGYSTRYEGQLTNMAEESVRPFVLAYKSSVRVTIN